ncbi:MAG: DegT/DnrJ/EryC1/StrS family aminotransferase [Clostridia bacterium]|nr:DegT/DnrJ/EryC1/StrS family aminotransferase [Clostridia bacterium]
MKRAEKRIVLPTPTMHGEEMKFVQEAFDKNWIAPLGFNCDNFEKEMNDYLIQGIDKPYYTLALSSGTAALHLAMKLAGVKRGDRVFCSSMTFAATVNPVSYEGGVQVFIDSEPDTWNMDPVALEKAFQKYPDTKFVVLAHLYGTPSKMDEILAICKKHGAVLIEDAAESLSATYRGRQTGTFGKYNAISFNGNKIITTSGGGMLITDTEEARKKAFFWATQSREPFPWYQHEEIGYNYRMSNVVAGIGRGQLIHLDEHRERKEAIYKRYAEGLKDAPVKMNPYLDYTMPNFWLSCLTINEGVGVTPLELAEKLNEANIETRPIWKPMHMQPVFKDNDFISAYDKPVSEDIFARGLCLPSDIKMTVEEQDFVIEAIKESLR